MLINPFPKIKNTQAILIPFPAVSELLTANVFALGQGPITLIDAGPKLPGSLEAIRDGLNLAGLSIKDVERIIITHGHIDHFGLAARVQEAAGHPVEFFLHPEDVWRATHTGFQEPLRSEGLDELRATVDMPQDELEGIKQRISYFYTFADPLDQVQPIEDGDEFVGDGYHIRVIHTPGHSPGMCCLYESTQKILFSGDHIIKHITPNPILEINRDRLREPDYQSLKAYRASLEKIAGLDVNFVFPGHGEYVEDLPGIITEYKGHHEQRMELVWHAIKKKRRPLYHLVSEIFPEMPENDLFLALSEIIAHLEILINEGRAELADPGPPALYRAL